METRRCGRMVTGMVVLVGALAPAAAGGPRVAVEADAARVKRYAKVEFTIRTDAVAGNPYDPGEIDLRVELTTPTGGKISYPAFYYQPCERAQRQQGGRKAEWVYPTGPGGWKARFTPTEVGAWKCEAVLSTPGGSARSAAVAFECTPSPGKGFVRVSAKDRRYLEFEDGTAFFPVGQDVAFVHDFYKSAEMLKKLGEHGANFVRVWACCEDWAMAVEARKSGWGRSWSWDPPIVRAPGREGFHSEELCVGLAGPSDTTIAFSPTRPLALRAGAKYRLTGKARSSTGAGLVLQLGGGQDIPLECAKGKWTPFRHEFTTGPAQWWLERLAFRSIAACKMYLKDLSLTEAAGGPELLVEADVNRPLIGRYNQIDCFLLDKLVEAAEADGLYLQLTMLTRDHYMPLLGKPAGRDYDRAVDFGKRLVRYFVARWGYSPRVAVWEYFNEMNPSLPTGRFYGELGDELAALDPHCRPRANSAWASPSPDYKHPKLDTADLHWYMRPAEGELWKDAAAGVLSRAALARRAAPDRPVLFSEFGMTADNWQRAPELDADKEFVHLHNGLWASALSGMASTVCHWWWDDIHKKDMYHHYRPISAFVADIPFTTAGLKTSSATCDKPLRVVGLQGDGCAYVWIADPQATWWNLAVGKKAPGRIEGASLSLTGLKPGSYAVQWWDTWAGKVIRSDAVRAGEGELRLPVPAFERDTACKIAGPGTTEPARGSEQASGGRSSYHLQSAICNRFGLTPPRRPCIPSPRPGRRRVSSGRRRTSRGASPTGPRG